MNKKKNKTQHTTSDQRYETRVNVNLIKFVLRYHTQFFIYICMYIAVMLYSRKWKHEKSMEKYEEK